MKRIVVMMFVLIMISACGTANHYLVPKTKVTEYLRIFDFKTSAPRQSVAKAASAGLGRNTTEFKEATPIPSGDVPEKPGRFKLVNRLEGSRYAKYAGNVESISMRAAKCEDAVWVANAQRTSRGNYNLNLYACLYQYKDGYHLDVYSVFTKQEGGLQQVSRDMAYSVVGSAESWVEKTILDIVRSIQEQTASKATLVEAQPELIGTPWLDRIDEASK